VSTPQTLEEFMALALAMEREAAERYTDFADTLEAHNNRDVAALFRTMAKYEARHAEQIMAQMGWSAAPALPATSPWPEAEAPETVPIDEVHYLMQPWHALQLALAAERRAERFFAELARRAEDESVRRAAQRLQAEEAEHVALVQAWLAQVPPPSGDWDLDPDPPRYND
jgi:rubrerythrin